MIFKNLKFRNKIILMPIAATVAFLLILLISQLFNSKNDNLLTQIDTAFVPASELCSKLEGELANIQRSLQYAASAEDQDELEKVEQLKTGFLALLEEGRTNIALAVEEFNTLDQDFNQYYPLAFETTQLMISGGMNDQVIQQMQEMQKKYNAITEKLTSLTSASKNNMTNAITNARQNQQTSTISTIAITIFAILLLAGFSFFLISGVTKPLGKIMDVAEELASGNNDVEISLESRDEIGQLATVFSTLINTNQKLAEAAIAIGNGDYSIPIELRSEQDTLGNALSMMRSNLISSSKEIDEKNWLKTGQADLNDKMRGEQDLTTLAQNVIHYIATYLKAQIGAIYLMDEKDDVLRLVGSYAYKKRKNISNEYKLGEGIIGQAALERQSIILGNVPEDYIKINSGLGETSPHNILVMPFLYEDKVKGVIELGSFDEFNSLQMKLFEDVAENIGITFNSSESRTKMKELLGQTQQQAEELQSQQEELRQINEELEDQTKSLKESEGRLQQQQEELQQTNEELEEKTQELEKQKEDIRKKNMALEETSELLEDKARDLELTSKYKSEFLANMSHELRTPLNSLLILSKLLSENKNENLTEKQVEFATTIHSSGSDLLNLINEILDLSKVESGKIDVEYEKIDLHDFSESIKQKFQHVAKDKGLKFGFHVARGIPAQAITDGQRLEQIIKNFLSNAFKFTEKGAVALNIHRPAGEIDLSNSGLDASKTIAFSVSDTGKGIPKDKQRLVFEAFQQEDGTTRRKYGGTGLGLSISRELAKLLGGEIHLISDVGKGSTFTLYMPEEAATRVEPPTQAPIISKEVEVPVEKPDYPERLVSDAKPVKPRAEWLPDDRKILTSQDKSLLIVEDDSKFANILFELAHDKGFKCLLAEDGESGLDDAVEYKPSAIILDIKLPGIDGWTVMERLKNNLNTRHIPVHFMTATKKSLEAMKMGAIGCLTKPISMKKLNGAFKKIEETISKDIKSLLVVEDDEDQRKSIIELIGNGDVHSTAVGKGEEAYKLLKEKSFDCVILDLGLEDISGFELLEKIRGDKTISHIPVITYTGKDLSKEENLKLEKYSESIIIKGAKSPERLLEETSLFLHRVDKNLPEEKQKMMRVIHDSETIFESKKILVVDDDIRNVYALTNILEEKKMEVMIAQNGKEALASLKDNAKPDLVLMDIMMPEMDGFETMREIRKLKKFKMLPMIAITAKAMKGDKSKCIEAGANDYLSKPIDTDKLFSMMRVWLYK